MTIPKPTLLENIIFPSQSGNSSGHNFSKILGDLKKSNLSITNRLKSILADANFVEQVADSLSLPLVANERCGSWYIDPQLKKGSAYFKSTDGHTGQWKFSCRRLNLHLLELIGKENGCIIVDSTRRGKRHPDALSKTIPTWCAVLNRVLFPDNPSSCHQLFVPPNTVSDSEAAQITALLPEFVSSFLALAIDLQPLRDHLQKPLRPLWVTQEDDLSLLAEGLDSIRQEFHPVVCCTSSRRVVGTELGEGGYIQGAGDDTENWALGLTAPVWWKYKEELLDATEGELPELIKSLVEKEGLAGCGDARNHQLTQVAAPGILVGTLQAVDAVPEGSCLVAVLPKPTDKSEWVKSDTHIEVGLGKNKIASRVLREALPEICKFVSKYAQRSDEEKRKIVVLCETGKDLSMGVALAIYCWCFDASGKVRTEEAKEGFNKTGIRVKLGHIMTAVPDANPSRATLQSVNSFLMDWRK
ncbi:putative tRNA A64-2'-O-ribosylphosphate transferase [Podospora fimiseda]|uniref:tRNA A64-2'-O-ribosylphosphate transferase n=1 Tax=Podospora fimiseda TaxID=252190 RepID=A0AAN7BRL1_9PEZI|nr:putative tRNA A64-2'-O-ribosylphosphate transferase [Podospora fimiseda]